MNIKEVKRLGPLALALGTLALAGCDKATPPSPDAGKQKPETTLLTATDPGVDHKNFTKVTIGVGKGPSTLLGALNHLKSDNAFNELEANRAGIHTFAIMREGNPLNYEYPPKSYNLQSGDVVVRFGGLSSANVAAAANELLRNPKSGTLAKFEGALSAVFKAHQISELETTKTELDKAIATSLKSMGDLFGPAIEIKVKPGQTFGTIVSSLLEDSSKKIDTSTRIALNKLLVSFIADVYNPAIDPDKIRAGEILMFPNLSKFDRKIAENSKNIDTIFARLSPLVDKLRESGKIYLKLSELEN